MKVEYLFVAALAAATALCSVPMHAQQVPRNDERIADLVQRGQLRVGLFPPQYSKDAATGEIRSVWVEVGRALAARIGVPVELKEHPTPPQAIACLKGGGCDILFLPFDARASDVGEFSTPFIQLDYTLLAPKQSRVVRVSDADQAGVRIAAVRNHASTAALSEILKHGELVLAETPDQTFELLRSGKADVMASTRNALIEYSAQLPESRVLDDFYGNNLNRVVVPKGNAGRLAYVGDFVEEAKSSGMIQQAIDRAGPPGIKVAPPGDPK